MELGLGKGMVAARFEGRVPLVSPSVLRCKSAGNMVCAKDYLQQAICSLTCPLEHYLSLSSLPEAEHRTRLHCPLKLEYALKPGTIFATFMVRTVQRVIFNLEVNVFGFHSWNNNCTVLIVLPDEEIFFYRKLSIVEVKKD